MSDALLQHTKLASNTDYVHALDALCALAQRNLYLFEKNYEKLGYNGLERYETLRKFLLASSANRLFLLAHDTRHLATQCPRMMMLLRQFSASLFIYQTPKNLQHLTEPFAIADETHYVRRFHFDDVRGIAAKNDPENALSLKSRFLEMWSTSHPAVSATTLGL
jgi:hypothetical protein